MPKCQTTSVTCLCHCVTQHYFQACPPRCYCYEDLEGTNSAIFSVVGQKNQHKSNLLLSEDVKPSRFFSRTASATLTIRAREYIDTAFVTRL